MVTTFNLHTKKSLTKFLSTSGFRDIEILGVQRYNIANHFGWLKIRHLVDITPN